MNAEQLKAIRTWAQRGNDTKFACDIEDLLPEELGAWRMLDKHEDSLCELTPAAVMLARTLDALEHANETAEMYHESSGDHLEENLPCRMFAMRANRKELLG